MLSRTLALAAGTLAVSAALGTAVAGAHGPAHSAPGALPSTIALPNGFQPEGIAAGPGGSLYVGSIPTGAIYRTSARTGRGSVLVPAQPGRQAIGIKVQRGVIWTSGGPTGKAFLYDAHTGANLATADLATGPSFINDVAVTGRSAWFTDSIQPTLRRVDLRPDGTVAVTQLPITGDLQYDADPATFEANGIVALNGGRTLLVVQSRTGKLFRIDGRTGVSTELPLTGGDVTNGDGLLLVGRHLFVVRNQNNLIADVLLNRQATRGTIIGTITDPQFRVPTTIALQRGNLFAVNARFGTTPTPATDYDIVRVDGR